MRSIKVRAPARKALFGSAAGSLLCLLASGCASDSQLTQPLPAVVSSPKTESKRSDDTPQPTAIEAALARGDAANTSMPLRAADAPSGSDSPVLNPDAPRQYTVKRGDTLWGIASLFLRDPWLWPEIWQVNPAIANPHLIYPGDVLTLAIGPDGRPTLRLDRGDASALQGSTRVEPLARSAPLDSAIPTIPAAELAGLVGKPLLVSVEQSRRAPHVVALQERHVAVGAPHEVFVTGLAGAPKGRYTVVQLGAPLRDPATGKLQGYMGVYTGTIRVDATDKVTRATLLDSARETMAGDLVFPEEAASLADLVPRAPPAGVDGQIMAVVDGVTMIGQYQVVAINRGSRQGLVPGHVLAIHSAGETVRDKSCDRRGGNFCFGGKKVNLPGSRTGTLLVFKTYANVSYALTAAVTAPVRVRDRVRTP
ncbi:MAG: hypothetical protein RLZZ200_2647 [Pseudomonadota bacterium]|jgi:LysM repeat protein